MPPDAQWIGAGDLPELKLAVPEYYKVLEKWFLEAQHSESSNLRRPWARIGWYDTVLAWLEKQLEKLSYQAIAIEQCEVSDWSCISRIHTEGGDLYLKCCDPAFPHEAALTQTLSQLWPNAIPPVLEIERQ